MVRTMGEEINQNMGRLTRNKNLKSTNTVAIFSNRI